jgi:hypothetical protein
MSSPATKVSPIGLPADPRRFGLESFSDILPSRDPIVGEEPGSFAAFSEAMTLSLSPATPYECVIAARLIQLEWELIQQQRMLDASLRADIAQEICKATVSSYKHNYESVMNNSFDAHTDGGGVDETWAAPYEFDEAEAEADAEDLAMRAISHDWEIQAKAYEEITDLGLAPIHLLSSAHVNRTSIDSPTRIHGAAMERLERRAREVRRDFDLLRRARPIIEDAEILKG